MNSLFTNAFANLSPEELEDFYRTVFMNMDSPLGARLREEYYRGLLHRMGDNTSIGCGVKIVNPQHISLGSNVCIEDRCVLLARGEGGITIGDGVTLKHGVYLDTEGPSGYIRVGHHVYIGTGSCLHGHSGLEIGDHTLMAQNITITPYSHNFEDPTVTIASQGGKTRKVSIGRDCYIGKSVCVVYSADIEEGSVVGAGSVVVHTVPAYSVAVGVPAKVIRKRGASNR